MIHLRWTGRYRRAPTNRKGCRTSYWRFEYACTDCGHVGWTRHIDAERQFVNHGFNLPAGRNDV
jgi:hypothetical protein